MKQIVIIANNNIGHGLSGGDRIFIELARQWKKNTHVIALASEEAINQLNTSNVKDITIIKSDDRNPHGDNFSAWTLVLHQIRRTFKGILSIKKHNKILNSSDFVYSVSDFFPDLLPGLYTKLRFKKTKWIAAMYLTAAHPFSKEFPYKGFAAWIRGFLYYYGQKITYFLILKYADFVIFCSEIDRQTIIKHGFPAQQTYTIFGGVDLAVPNSVPPQPIKYDGVFMARFHPQKGPLEAVYAWREVVKTYPTAKLAMIGNGHEEEKVKKFIAENHLEKNIKLFGFMDGIEKYKLLKSSKIFVHSAIYEIGGMAAAEGMAAGLPVIAFNHKDYKYCYPKGMVCVSPIGNTKVLANEILELLRNKTRYNSIKKEAIAFVQEWDWKNRAKAFNKMLKN